MKKFNATFIALILLLGASAVSLRAQLPPGLSGKRNAYAVQDKWKLKANI
jgi:hypothetical protein